MRKYFLAIISVALSLFATAQIENSATEVMDYRVHDGRIIVAMLVNGVEADFVLDLAGHNAIMPEYMDKLKIDRSTLTTFSGYNEYQNKAVEVDGVYEASSASFGNNVFGNGVKFFALKNSEPYLKEMGVAGVVNAQLFVNKVLTIDTKRKKITTTAPYRPTYMKLDYRTSMEMLRGQAISFSININGVDTNVLLDTWYQGEVALSSADYAKQSSAQGVSDGGVMSVGYNRDISSAKQCKVDIKFINSEISGALIAENSSIKKSVVGLGFLNHGIVSIDFSKQKIYFQPHGLVEINDNIKPIDIIIEDGKLNAITRDWFINNIYDYRKGGDFVSQFDKPVVIDFWATWCGPCMKLLPQMEVLAERYKGKVVFLKVNADKEVELCNKFGVKALPTLFFIPAGGKPKVEVGATPAKYVQLIEDMLKK